MKKEQIIPLTIQRKVLKDQIKARYKYEYKEPNMLNVIWIFCSTLLFVGGFIFHDIIMIMGGLFFLILSYLNS